MEVSEECTTRPEFRGLWGVVKDWEGAEEGAREQVLVRLQNRDARRELGAREAWLPAAVLRAVRDARALRHSHSRRARAAYDLWARTTRDPAFMAAPLEADHLRAQREAARAELAREQQRQEEQNRLARERARQEEQEERERRRKRRRLAEGGEGGDGGEEKAWTVPGLVVRVVGGGVVYGRESLRGRTAVVVDVVSAAGACTLHVLPTTSDARTGITVDAVPAASLAPVRPPPGAPARVLRGPHCGATGEVVVLPPEALSEEETSQQQQPLPDCVALQLNNDDDGDDDDSAVVLCDAGDVCLLSSSATTSGLPLSSG